MFSSRYLLLLAALHKFPSGACLWGLFEASLCNIFNLLTLDVSGVLSGSVILLELVPMLGAVLHYNGNLIFMFVTHCVIYM